MVPSLNGILVPLDDCQMGVCALEYAYIEYVPTFGGNLAYFIIFALLLVAQVDSFGSTDPGLTMQACLAASFLRF